MYKYILQFYFLLSICLLGHSNTLIDDIDNLKTSIKTEEIGKVELKGDT